MSTRILILLCGFLLAVYSQAALITPITRTPLRPFSVNQNHTTDYSFSMYIPSAISAQASIEVEFPLPYQLSSTCRAHLKGPQGPIAEYPCTKTTSSKYMVNVGQIVPGEYQLIFENIKNPSAHRASSNFQIRTYYNQEVLVDSNEHFDAIPFLAPAATSNSASIQTLGYNSVSLGSRYDFTFTLTKSIKKGDSIKINFAEGFYFVGPACFHRNSGSYAPAEPLYNNRYVICQAFEHDMPAGVAQIVSVIGVENPDHAGFFLGFTIETMEGVSPNIIEKIVVPGPVEIIPGSIQIDVISDSLLLSVNTTHQFNLIFENDIPMTGQVWLKLPAGFRYLAANCSLLRPLQPQPYGNVTCGLAQNKTGYTIEGFSGISASQQISVLVTAENPPVSANYTVQIYSYSTQYEAKIDEGFTNIALQPMFGSSRFFKSHALRFTQRLKHNETGPLEFTFFLNIPLPATQSTFEGLIVIDIRPLVPYPPVGTLRCFFYNTVPADCTWDDTTDPTKTTISIKTPATDSYFQTEIPITITTETDSGTFGVKLDELIKRYKFYVYFYRNGELPPLGFHEVYYEDYVPEPIEMPDDWYTATWTPLQYGEDSYLKIAFTNNYLALGTNYFFELEFDHRNYAWDFNLGWPALEWYEKHDVPCFAEGLGDAVRCFLRPGGTLESKSTIQMIGLSEIAFGQTFNLHFPKIRFGTSDRAFMVFTLYENTPGENTLRIPIITRNLDFQPAAARTLTAGPFTTLSLTPNLPDVDTVLTMAFTSTPNPQSIIYQYPELFTLTTGVGDCGASNTCYIFSDPVRWIYFEPNPAQGTQALTSLTVRSPPHEGNFNFAARSVLNGIVQDNIAGTLPMQLGRLTVTFRASATNAEVNSNSVTLFDVAVTTMTHLPQNASVQFDFTQLTVPDRDDFYCQVTGVTGMDARNVICERIDGNSIRLYNLNEVPAGTNIAVTFQLTTNTIANVGVTINTFYERTAQNRVDQGQGTAALNFLYNNFVTSAVANNRAGEVVRAGKTGIFNFQITPTGTYGATSLVCTFAAGFDVTTATDQLMCRINGERRRCTFTRNPLTVTIPTRAGQLNANTVSTVSISSDFSQPLTQGIFAPTRPGWYPVSVAIGRGNPPSEQIGDYIYVYPASVPSLAIEAVPTTAGAFAMYTFTVTTKVALNSNLNGVTKGRMFIDFPVSAEAFAGDLGTGLETGQYVGCNIQGLVSIPNIHCRLIQGNNNGLTASVEILGFGATAANTAFTIRVARIRNPTVTLGEYNIAFRTDQLEIATGIVTPLEYTKFALWHPVTPQGGVPNFNGGEATYQGASAPGEPGRTFGINVFAGRALAPNDYYVYELPAGTVPDWTITCPAGVSNCWSFPDSRWVVYQLNRNLGANNQFDGTIRTVTLPRNLAGNGYTFTAYAWSNDELDHTVTFRVNPNSYNTLTESMGQNNLQMTTDGVGLNRANTQVTIRFNPGVDIPNTGQVEIRFPAGFTLTSGCNSNIGPFDPQGQISCVAQGTSWIMTNMDNINNGQGVTIRGTVTLPGVAGLYNILAITYSNQGGQRLEVGTTVFNLGIGTPRPNNGGQAPTVANVAVTRIGVIPNIRSVNLYEIRYNTPDNLLAPGTNFIIRMPPGLQAVPGKTELIKFVGLRDRNDVVRAVNAVITAGGDVMIQGYAAFDTSRDGTMVIQMYLRNIASGDFIFSIDVFDATNTRTSTVDAAPVRIEASPNPMVAGVVGPYLTDALDVYSTETYKIKINIGMRTALAAANGRFVITLATGFALQNTQQICKYSRDNGAHWIRSTGCTVAGTTVTMPLEPGFTDLQAGDTVNIIITTNNADDTLAGIVRPASGTISTFNVKSQQGGATRESAFIPVVVYPLPENVNAVWFNREWNGLTIASMGLTLSQAITANDFFQLELVTFDEIERVYPETLGQTPTERRILSNCARDPRSNLISDNIALNCYTIPGSATLTPSIMAKVVIINEKNIAAGSTVRVLIAGIQNPRNSIPGGYVFNIMRPCRTDGYGCPIFRRRDYTMFLQGRAANPVAMSIPTLPAATSDLFVAAVPTTFRLDLSPLVDTTDALVFKTEIENIELNSPCAVTAPAGICISFPRLKWTFYQPANRLDVGTRAITISLDNGLFFDRDNLLDFEAESWVSGRVAQTFTSDHPAYTVMIPTLTTTPTQAAPDIQRIVRNFDNILQLSMDNVWRTEKVRRITVNIPGSYAPIADDYCMAGCNMDDISSPDFYQFACQKTGDRQMLVIIDDDWQPTFENFTVVVYYRGFLRVNATWGQTTDSTITSYASINLTQNWVVDENTAYSFYVDPVPTPIIRDVNLNLKSFNDRIARISDFVEFYGAVWPYTPFDPSNNVTKITQILFQVDDEFGYPALNTLLCYMKVITRVQVNCTLRRKQGRTEVLVEMPPDYEHGPFLIRITNTEEKLLFKAPDHEGAFQFNMTMMNSTGGMVEQADSYMEINGDYVNNFTAEPILIDPLVKTLYDVQFTTTGRVTPQGLVEPGQAASTQIVLLFQTYDPAFPIDLGSGLANDSEISCVPVQGITLTKTGKLTCRLIYGTPIVHTQIIITGYDAIPALSNVRIYIDEIATLALATTSRIKLEIRSTYVGSDQQFLFYNSLEVSPTEPTAVQSNAARALTITRTGSTTIREASAYEFAFTTTTALTANQDYFIIEFPQYGYEQDADYTNVLITITTPAGNSNGYVMPKRNVIYVQPTDPIAAGAITITIQNLPNPSFALSGPQTYTVSTVVNRKVIDIFTTQLTTESSVCQLFSNEQITSSSKFARVNENTYQISFTMQHDVPADGSLAVIFDPNLYNLRPSSPQCQLVQGFSDKATCEFELFSQQLVRIKMNGVLLASNTTVKVNIINVNNPIDSSTAPAITLQSYYDAEFGTTKTICSKNITLPAFMAVNSISCPVQIQPDLTNAGQVTDYLITLSCATSMRNATMIDIEFPSDFQNSFPTDLSCSTNGNYMLKECVLIARTTRVNILISKPDIQAPLVVRVRGVRNPALPGLYGPFAVNLLQYEVQYATFDPVKSTTTITITSNDNSITAANRLSLSIFPKNYGEKATYYFDLTSLQPKSAPKEVLVKFDNAFSRDIGPSLECGVFTPQSQFGTSYALNYQYQEDLKTLPCSVVDDYILKVELSPTVNLDPTQTQDFFFYVKNVVNPSLTQEASSATSHNFDFTFTADQKAVLVSTNTVPVSFELPPSLFEVSKIDSTDDNMISPASYTLTLEARDSLPVASYSSSSNYEIQLALPDYYPSMSPDATVNYSFPGNTEVEAGSSAFGSQNLIYFNANYPDFNETGPFQITLNNMFNPAVRSDCGLNAAGMPVKFETQYVNREEGFVFGRTYNIMDQGNCLPVEKDRAAIKIVAPLYLRQGLVYTVTIQVEELASDLDLTPISNFLTFEPKTVSFTDYKKKTADVKMIVSKFVPEGDYTIQWKKEEDSKYIRYLNVEDTKVIVVSETAPSTVTPLPNVQVEDIRYVWTGKMPREVKVTLTQEPTEDLTLQVGIKVQDYKLQGSLDGVAYSDFPISVKFGPREKEKIFFIFADEGTRDNSLTYTLTGANSKSFDPVISNTPFMIRKSQGASTFQIFSVIPTSTTENNASYLVSLSDVGTIFYMAVVKSSIVPTLANLVLSQLPGVDNLYYQAGSFQIEKIQDGTSLSGFVNFTSLSAQTRYQLYFVARSIYGEFTPVKKMDLQTRRISEGASVLIPALSAIDANDLIEALSIILPLAKSRLVFSGSEEYPAVDSDNGTHPYIGDQLNEYRITIAPDAYNNNPTPMEIAQTLLTEEKQTQLQAFIPDYYKQGTIRIAPVKRGSPRFIVTPSVGSFGYYTLGVDVELIDTGKLYAIITDKSKEGDIKPTSYQIANGLTASNVKVADNFYKKIVTNENGNGQLIFDDLKDHVDYSIYLTAGNDVPYEPADLLEDDGVHELKVTTLKNPNVGTRDEAIALYEMYYDKIYDFSNSGSILNMMFGALLMIITTVLIF